MSERVSTQITLTRVDDGDDGKSAYEAAIEGGLPVATTEQQFNEDLAEVPATMETADEAKDIANTNKQNLTFETSERERGSLTAQGFAVLDAVNGKLIIASGNNQMVLDASVLSFINGNQPTAWVLQDGNSSYFKADNAQITTLKMKTLSGVGGLAWIAESDGHLSLKAVD